MAKVRMLLHNLFQLIMATLHEGKKWLDDTLSDLFTMYMFALFNQAALRCTTGEK